MQHSLMLDHGPIVLPGGVPNALQAIAPTTTLVFAVATYAAPAPPLGASACGLSQYHALGESVRKPAGIA